LIRSKVHFHDRRFLPGDSSLSALGDDPAQLPGLASLRTIQAWQLERFGADKPMPIMLRDLKRCEVGQQCQLREGWVA